MFSLTGVSKIPGWKFVICKSGFSACKYPIKLAAAVFEGE
jgi:hypothetical protein